MGKVLTGERGRLRRALIHESMGYLPRLLTAFELVEHQVGVEMGGWWEVLLGRQAGAVFLPWELILWLLRAHRGLWGRAV